MPRTFARISAALFLLTLTTPILAGPRNRASLAEQNEPSAPEGIEFHDPLVEECMALMRKGDAVDAMSRLEKEVARAVGEQKAEIQLGLAMLYLRSGQQAKAKPVIISLVARKDGGALGGRAGILERVMKKYSAKKSGDWMDASTWAKQLTNVANDLSKEVVAEHQKVFAAMRDENWAQLASHVSNARERVRIASEIKVGNVADDVALKHIDGLATIVRQVNSDLDRGFAQAKNLEQQIREFERYRKNRLPGSRPPNANSKVEYNDLVTRLNSAWESAKPFDDELERLTEDYGSPRIKKRDRLIPKSRLPVPR